jgi:hypothetical protein
MIVIAFLRRPDATAPSVLPSTPRTRLRRRVPAEPSGRRARSLAQRCAPPHGLLRLNDRVEPAPQAADARRDPGCLPAPRRCGAPDARPRCRGLGGRRRTLSSRRHATRAADRRVGEAPPGTRARPRRSVVHGRLPTGVASSPGAAPLLDCAAGSTSHPGFVTRECEPATDAVAVHPYDQPGQVTGGAPPPMRRAGPRASSPTTGSTQGAFFSKISAVGATRRSGKIGIGRNGPTGELDQWVVLPKRRTAYRPR